jgi:two-component system, cell cycle sensor histidine kinase and response regulator CckA
MAVPISTNPPPEDQRADDALERLEQALRADEGRYRLIAELVSDTVFALHIGQDGVPRLEWRVSSGNLESGYEPHEVARPDFWQMLVHPDDRAGQAALWPRLLANETVSSEYRIVTKGGQVRWLRNYLRPIWSEAERRVVAIYGALREISEQKQAELALEQSEARHRLLVRNLPDTAMALLDSELRYLLAEGQALLAQPADLIGRKVDDIWTQEELRHIGPLYRNALAGKHAAHAFEYQGHSYRLQALPVRLDDGTDGVMAVMQDVTALARAEEERLQIERKLQDTQRLEGLGVLAGGIAHDFNNLLGGILGHAQLALMDDSVGAEARESIVAVETIARSAAELTAQLLAYAGKGRVVVAPLDLNILVREMRDLLQVSIARHCQVAYHCDGHLPSIEADSAQLRQVVLNLLVNASEAIEPPGGTIRVTTALEQLDRQQLAGLTLGDELPPGSYVCLTVADDGCGMDAATLTRIFEPFFSTKFTGRGLGLAAVLGIVRAHRGALEVSSTPGKGTVFRVWFPALGVPSGIAEQPQRTPSVRHDGAILIIDDDQQVREISARFLQRMGFSVFTAPDGSAGLAMLRAGIPNLALVLLDLTMPQLSGDRVAQLIHELMPNTPVLLMSGYNARELENEHAGLGLAGFIQKPFSFDALQRAINQARSTQG